MLKDGVFLPLQFMSPSAAFSRKMGYAFIMRHFLIILFGPDSEPTVRLLISQDSLKDS